MPLSRVTNLVNGNVVDAPELNSEFNNIINALNSTNAVDIIIRFSSPTIAGLVVNQQGTGPIARYLQNGADRVTVLNTGTVETIAQFKSTVAIGTQPLDVVSTTKCNNLNADFIDGIDGVDIARLSLAKTAFSFSFFEPDPSISSFSSADRVKFICPDGNTITLTKATIVFSAGSHGAGGNLIFTLRRTNASGALLADFATIALSDTNNTANVVYEVNFTDVTLDAKDQITYFISTRAAPTNERAVSIAIFGTQKLFN